MRQVSSHISDHHLTNKLTFHNIHIRVSLCSSNTCHIKTVQPSKSQSHPQPGIKMKFTTVLFSLVSILSTTTLVVAHPPNFAPNHATLQKRCPPFDPAGVKNIGNGKGTQFIGGQCLSTADCASGCCANPCGICSGPGAQFQAGKTGCGFGETGGSSSSSSTGTGTTSSSSNDNSGSSTNTGSGTSTCNANTN